MNLMLKNNRISSFIDFDVTVNNVKNNTGLTRLGIVQSWTLEISKRNSGKKSVGIENINYLCTYVSNVFINF